MIDSNAHKPQYSLAIPDPYPCVAFDIPVSMHPIDDAHWLRRQADIPLAELFTMQNL